MTKKLSFDELPQAVAAILEKLDSRESDGAWAPELETLMTRLEQKAVAAILEKLDSRESGGAAAPELEARMTRLERKIEQVLALLAPQKPTMDMQTVCRVLKLSPKSVNDLEDSGVLISRKDGRSRLFDETVVIKYFRGTKTWKEAIAEPVMAEKPVAENPKKRLAGRPKVVKNVAEKTASEEHAVADTEVDAPKRKAGRPKSVNTLLRELPKDHQLDVQQASELLKRGKNTIYQLITRDKIPFHKDGRKVYFIADELRKWAKEHPARKKSQNK